MKFRTCAVLMGLVVLPVVTIVGESHASVEFKAAQPGYEWSFPADHASHPDYKTEWWYLTGIVSSGDREFGYQFTIFRSALNRKSRPGSEWFASQVFMGHMAISNWASSTHRNFLRTSRSYPRVAYSDTTVPGTIRVRDWVMTTGDTWTIHAGNGEDVSIQLSLRPTRPPLFQGAGGYSRKGPESYQASQYYSLSRMATEGTIRVGGETHSVRGRTWFDHEFGSSQLSSKQTGWDWVSLRLSDGSDLMIYRLRESGGTVSSTSSATLRGPDGEVRYIPTERWHMEPLEYWESPRTGARYPVRWRVTMNNPDLKLTIDRWFNNQEMVMEGALNAPYWEGVISARGQLRGQSITGRGYLEMTGYVRPLKGSF